MSLKFGLYYGVKEDGSLETIALKGRGSLGELKAQARKDCVSPAIAKKYSLLVVASDYGIVSRKKVVAPEKKAPAKKKEDK
jgi:hypothetical protein